MLEVLETATSTTILSAEREQKSSLHESNKEYVIIMSG
jgi:hypothetical protein